MAATFFLSFRFIKSEMWLKICISYKFAEEIDAADLEHALEIMK